MLEFYDLCIREKSEEVIKKAKEIGWQDPNSYSTKFIDVDDWGELKQKIKQNREDYDVLVFEGGNEKLNRKAASTPKMDVLLHPEKGRKDSGVDKVIAENAAENDVAIGFSLKQLKQKPKVQSHILGDWRKNLILCEKYDTPYVITSEATQKYGLRAPRDLASLIDSLGYNGKKALQTQKEILKKNKKLRKSK